MAISRSQFTTVTIMPYQATTVRLKRLLGSHVMPAVCLPLPSSPAMPTAALSSGKASDMECVSFSFESHAFFC